LAWAIPLAEIVIAVALIIGKTRKTGLYGSLGLMTLFTIYVIYVMSFKAKWPCSCGGMIRDLTWPQHLVFNLFFVAISVIGLWIMKKSGNDVRRVDGRLAGV
jgi:putative oxidoreductase